MTQASRSETARARRRRAHVGRLLYELSARFERESLERMRAKGHAELTLAQKNVIVHLPLAGARLTDLAARAGITKQAMMRLVDGLEALGYVERGGDPSDQRAKSVRPTKRGLALIDDGLAVVEAMEREWARALGARDFDRLRADLARLVEALGIELPDPAS